MNKKFSSLNKHVALTILFIVVLVFAVIILAKNRSNNLSYVNTGSSELIVLFYGDGCPHCAKVDEYLSENNIKNKISFVEKEVYHDQQNADELVKKAKICGLPTDSIAVPFL